LLGLALLSIAVWKWGASGQSANPGKSRAVAVWLTTGDQRHLLERQEDLMWQKRESGDGQPPLLTVREDETFQTIDGFGAAVTGSSAYLINRKLTAEQQKVLLDDLFTAQGINIGFVRHTIGASDFNVGGSYTYDDVAEGTDYALERFSIAKDEDVLAVLQKTLALHPGLKVMGSPWSAPAWMKTGKELNGGSLNEEDSGIMAAYADYFARYIEAYRERGVPIYAITPQNEPLHETANYPSMRMSPLTQADFIGNHLGPTLAKRGLDSKIIAYDHNWDNIDYADLVLGDPKAAPYTDGSAWHCYAGEPGSQQAVYNSHPDKNIYFTECSGGAWANDFGDNLAWNLSTLIIGATRNHAKAVLLWNMALDEQAGPQNGGCSDCRGVVTVQDNGEVVKNVEYYAIGHASKFVQDGAVRIGSDEETDGLEQVAFRNPDGSLALITVNTGGEELRFTVDWGGQAFDYALPPKSAATFQWAGAQEK